LAQSAESGGIHAAGSTEPHAQINGTQREMGVTPLGRKQEIAIGIALQTQVLKTCPIHNKLYCDDEQFTDDENIARAFAIAIELVRQHEPYAEEFHHCAHELTDLLSYTIGSAPLCCPDCVAPRYAVSEEAGARAPLAG
jgi:hypothetical protein